jgi:predicted GIY-YIG superfamily endonuclease
LGARTGCKLGVADSTPVVNIMDLVEYFVYVLVSRKDGKAYVGITNNLLRRYYQHAEGWVASTRKRRPLVMVHWESCLDRKVRKPK